MTVKQLRNGEGSAISVEGNRKGGHDSGELRVFDVLWKTVLSFYGYFLLSVRYAESDCGRQKGRMSKRKYNK